MGGERLHRGGMPPGKRRFRDGTACMEMEERSRQWLVGVTNGTQAHT
jgi:hypothetical protein